MPDERLPRCRILKDSNRIRDILQHGRRRSGRLLTIYLSPSERPRAAFLVPRRYGNAVVRNLEKRRLREWYRRNCTRLPLGRDVLILLRAGDRRQRGGVREIAGWQELVKDLDGLIPAESGRPGPDPPLSV